MTKSLNKILMILFILIANPSVASIAGATTTTSIDLPPPQLSFVTQNFGLQINSKSNLQRVELNSDVLMSSQNKLLNDVYVVDHKGQKMDSALLSSKPPKKGVGQATIDLKPILVKGRTSQSFEGMKLEILEKNGISTARLVSPTGTQTPLSGAKVDMGAIFDTRNISSNLESFVFQVVLPEQQAIHFHLQASHDLMSWRTIADTVLYQNQEVKPIRPSIEHTPLSRIDLELVQLKNQYLRLVWTNSNGVAVPVVFKKAYLELTSIKTQATRQTTELKVDKDIVSKAWIAHNPYSASISGLLLTVLSGVAPMTVQLWAKQKDSSHWQALGQTTILPYSNHQVNPISNELKISPNAYEAFRIELINPQNQAKNELTLMPKIEVIFAPVELIFLATGQEPYALAVGLANKHDSFNNIKNIIPNYSAGDENNIPLAEIEKVAPSASSTTHNENTNSNHSDTIGLFQSSQSLVWWSLLIFTLIMMAFITRSQMRSPS